MTINHTLYPQTQDDDSLPKDLHDLLHNYINETVELDQRYHINHFQNKEKRFEIEEIELSKFIKPLNFFNYGNNEFISVDKFQEVIIRLTNLTPQINIIIPNEYQNKILKVVSIGEDISKAKILDEILIKYKLKIEKSKIEAKVLELDFSTFKKFEVPEIDTMQFNSLNYYKKDNFYYLKDIDAENLEYFYYFQTKQLLRLVRSDSIVIDYLKLDISNKEILDKQLMQYFIGSRFISVEQDFIRITEKNE